MNKAERLNQELIFLNYKNFFQVKDLIEEFAISKRTALRDISELEQMGLSIYAENGRNGGYHIISYNLMIPITFSLEEVNAIFFAIKSLNLLSATPFEKSYSHIYDKLMATLPQLQQKQVQKMQQVIQYYNAPTIAQTKFLETILQTALDEKVIEVTSQQFPGSRLLLQPYDLLYRNGIWFFNAYDFTDQRWWTYRIDKITNISTSDDTKPLTRTQLEVKNQQDVIQNHPIRFKCALTKKGCELFQKNNYPNMELQTESDRSFMVGSYSQNEFSYMIEYLISLGNNVTIIYPEALKNGYLKEVQQMISQYSN
ncbi:helix-turn-helix transcriptional regulator [Companilactobacillus furfuricola]|uniref:helix-turn-helix transcriptional regulator n=1 Tax=Companilactobacillus furfuricola TaxID=1462575 RepID=UPI000F771132|nr:WYL domain-containing protein [Companilactobacillus furfuricola]